MNAHEFVAKMINDKNFLLEACKLIPEEYLDKSSEGKQEGQKEGETSNPDIFGELFFPAAQAMGIETTQEEINAEVEAQIKALGPFKKMSFMVRLFKTMGKAKKSK